MASILRLTMTDAVVANENVDIRKSFFWLINRGVYTPTESPIAVNIKGFDLETGNRIKKVLESDEDCLQQAVEKLGNVSESPISNMQLEVCVSKDGSFAAYQLLKYEGLDYRPVTPARIYEGASAKLVSSAL